MDNNNIKIAGYASLYNIQDYHNDVIKHGAFEDDIELFKKNQKKIRLFVNHNIQCPIAKVIQLTSDHKGLYMEATIDANEYNQDLIYQLKQDLINDLSVGIIPIKFYNEKNVRIITKAQLLEISLVTIGANPHARLDPMK
jgi:HK97 family phage prohead protease